MTFARVLADAAWREAALVGADVFRRIDQNLTAAVDGDSGGTWSPAAVLEVGGAGMRALSAWSLGAGSVLATAPGAPFVHGDGDYAEFRAGHAAERRELVTALADLRTLEGRWQHERSTASARASPFAGPRGLTPLDVHDGATFERAVFTFYVGRVHVTPPESPPRVRVLRMDAVDGSVTPLRAAGDGFVAFADASAWLTAGIAQSITYVCDPGHVIDRSRFVYIADVQDARGASAQPDNTWTMVTATMTTIPGMRPP